MTTDHAILLAVLACLGAWAVWTLCKVVGRWVADVVFGREPGGRR